MKIGLFLFRVYNKKCYDNKKSKEQAYENV